MSPTARAVSKLPAHLRRYVVDQDYDLYTPRDHAVWRHIVRRLAAHLESSAHPVYLEGLAAAGIGTERIPSLDEMNEKLSVLGWSCVGVRGFIPPAVFTELQAMGVLAIACDIRSHEHVEYTPAPDVIHESAGHAPILANARYAEYLKRCGEVGFRAIASLEDEAVFDAIRNLSVVKEDPFASPTQVRAAEERLRAANASRRFVSESTAASRLYWWTAEYGLVGDLHAPKIYGAGLLSSLGEAKHCLTEAVTKVPLSIGCVDVGFDITRMQPQLFVARDFDHLFEVLERFEATLAWKRGGDYGLAQARDAGTVNHLRLSDGSEITGRVVATFAAGREVAPNLSSAATLLEGPILTSRGGAATAIPWRGRALVAFGQATLPTEGEFAVRLASGLELTGYKVGEHEVVDLRASLHGEPLDVPSWALLTITPSLPSVAGGPADPAAWDRYFGALDTFGTGRAEAEARDNKATSVPAELAELYREVRSMRERAVFEPHSHPHRLASVRKQAGAYPADWLLRAELDELETALNGRARRSRPSTNSNTSQAPA